MFVPFWLMILLSGFGCWGILVYIKAPRNNKEPAADTLSKQYYELLFSVERKFPNESRHQTALRYIQQAESDSKGEGVAVLFL